MAIIDAALSAAQTESPEIRVAKTAGTSISGHNQETSPAVRGEAPLDFVRQGTFSLRNKTERTADLTLPEPVFDGMLGQIKSLHMRLNATSLVIKDTLPGSFMAIVLTAPNGTHLVIELDTRVFGLLKGFFYAAREFNNTAVFLPLSHSGSSCSGSLPGVDEGCNITSSAAVTHIV
jgi:hypothetical protein